MLGSIILGRFALWRFAGEAPSVLGKMQVASNLVSHSAMNGRVDIVVDVVTNDR